MHIRYLVLFGALLASHAVVVEAQIYKCVDTVTKKVTYGDRYCPTGDVTRLTVTENAVVDGAAAQREIARRKEEVAQQNAARRSHEQQQGAAQREFYDQQVKAGRAYSNYQATQSGIRPYAKTQSQVHDLAKSAIESQRVDSVEDALRRTGGGKSQYTAEARAALETCKKALNSGGRCDTGSVAMPPPLPKIIGAPPVADSFTPGTHASGSTDRMDDFGSQSSLRGTGAPSAGSSAPGYGRHSTSMMCPDGSYVASGPCRLCPNGQYVGGGTGCELTPNGSYVSRGKEPARLMPDGSYIPGGYGSRMCPDGTYVAGSSCRLTPNGSYVGGR